MKRTAFLLAFLLIGISTATAAPKSVIVKKLNLITINQDVERFVVLGKTIVTISNSDGVNTNIVLTGLDITGIQLWQKIIDSGVDDVALAATTDAFGNLWLAGASSLPLKMESATAQIQVENPDGVVSEPVSPLRQDMDQLTLWKISSQGELVATYSSPQSAPALINAISVNASGISVVGSVQEKPFALSATLQGAFSKPIYIGTSKTSLNAITRQADGSLSIFGTSSENLGGKKLIGVRDGILLKISKSGAISSVVRSSAPKADRSWISADSTLALTGYVKTGKNIETAFTKFSTAFVPTWTLRVPSTGTSVVTSGGGSTFGAFTSRSALAGVTGWKPATPTLLLMTFDNKGVITSAYSSPDLADPLSLSYSKELGLIGLAKTKNQSVTLFTIS
jgi:hypothetical protein